MEYLYVVIDYGSSLIKVEYGKELNHCPDYFSMQPEVIKVSPIAIEGYQELFTKSPTNYAYVGTEGTYYAVGRLAQEDFRSTANLSEPKLSCAVERTLAVIAVAAQKSEVGKKFKLFLSCLKFKCVLIAANSNIYAIVSNSKIPVYFFNSLLYNSLLN